MGNSLPTVPFQVLKVIRADFEFQGDRGGTLSSEKGAA
jgi:hypothetical protein